MFTKYFVLNRQTIRGGLHLKLWIHSVHEGRIKTSLKYKNVKTRSHTHLNGVLGKALVRLVHWQFQYAFTFNSIIQKIVAFGRTTATLTNSEATCQTLDLTLDLPLLYYAYGTVKQLQNL